MKQEIRNTIRDFLKVLFSASYEIIYSIIWDSYVDSHIWISTYTVAKAFVTTTNIVITHHHHCIINVITVTFFSSQLPQLLQSLFRKCMIKTVTSLKISLTYQTHVPNTLNMIFPGMLGLYCTKYSYAKFLRI